MRARTAARATVFAVTAALAAGSAGCGDTPPTDVIAPHVVQRRDVLRYPPGPQRSALELLRALQYNEPDAAGRWLTSDLARQWPAITQGLETLRGLALSLRVPRAVPVERRGRGTALVPIRLGSGRMYLRWVRRSGGWRLAAIEANTAQTASAVTYLLFSVYHPELHGRRLRPQDRALDREYRALYRQVLRQR
jgi:hypothetical protein